jgi:hypothetical protein
MKPYADFASSGRTAVGAPGLSDGFKGSEVFVVDHTIGVGAHQEGHFQLAVRIVRGSTIWV